MNSDLLANMLTYTHQLTTYKSSDRLQDELLDIHDSRLATHDPGYHLQPAVTDIHHSPFTIHHAKGLRKHTTRR